MANGKLFVISGASGVGKSTVLSRVMAGRTDLRFSVSATTRSPRPGETDGKDYYFISKDKFLEMIDCQAFLEYDAHMDNYYGTPEAQVEEKLCTGSVILDIDPNGAFNVRAKRNDAVLIFIAPPSAQQLEQRLRGRGDTTEEQMKMRLARASWEMEQSVKYDYIVTKDGEVYNITGEYNKSQLFELLAEETPAWIKYDINKVFPSKKYVEEMTVDGILVVKYNNDQPVNWAFPIAFCSIFCLFGIGLLFVYRSFITRNRKIQAKRDARIIRKYGNIKK